jgi:hypothetical protein
MLDTKVMAGYEEPDVEELLRSNPNADANQIEEARKIVGALRSSGIVTPPTYGIASPYERRSTIVPAR